MGMGIILRPQLMERMCVMTDGVVDDNGRRTAHGVPVTGSLESARAFVRNVAATAPPPGYRGYRLGDVQYVQVKGACAGAGSERLHLELVDRGADLGLARGLEVRHALPLRVARVVGERDVVADGERLHLMR